MSVNTESVTGRRVLKFASLDDVLADAERCARGDARTLGNWTVGQILSHLARSMNSTIDGMPFKAPWIARFVLGLMKQRFIRGPMSPGFQLPAAAAKTLVAPPTVSAEQGLDELRRAIARLQQTTERAPSPLFRQITREESDRLQITHSAMHLSFVQLDH